MRYRYYLLIAALVLVADQATKRGAWESLLGKPPVEVLPFVQFVLVLNRGAAFGLFRQADGRAVIFLSLLAAVTSLVILVWLWRVHRVDALLGLSLCLIMGGALGNLVDRVRYQYVIDFISVFYDGWYFPVFNLADSAITVGAVLFLCGNLRARRA